MNCCIGRRAELDNRDSNPQEVSQEVKKQLNSIDSQERMIAVFTAVMGNRAQRSALCEHFEKQHSPELPNFMGDFVDWQNRPTREGAANLFTTYFSPDTSTPIDVQSGDQKTIQVLLCNYSENEQLIRDMFMKYAERATKEIKSNYNPI